MIFNSNEEKINKKLNVIILFLNVMVFFFFFYYSNEDSGANFWVPFKMDLKF